MQLSGTLEGWTKEGVLGEVTGGFFPACETRTGNQLVNFGVIPAVRQKLGGEQSYFTGTFGKFWFVPESGDIFVEG